MSSPNKARHPITTYKPFDVTFDKVSNKPATATEESVPSVRALGGVMIGHGFTAHSVAAKMHDAWVHNKGIHVISDDDDVTLVPTDLYANSGGKDVKLYTGVRTLPMAAKDTNHDDNAAVFFPTMADALDPDNGGGFVHFASSPCMALVNAVDIPVKHFTHNKQILDDLKEYTGWIIEGNFYLTSLGKDAPRTGFRLFAHGASLGEAKKSIIYTLQKNTIHDLTSSLTRNPNHMEVLHQNLKGTFTFDAPVIKAGRIKVHTYSTLEEAIHCAYVCRMFGSVAFVGGQYGNNFKF